MFLIILDKDPYEAALKVPEYYKHKQLLELMQMLSCVVNFGYKQLPNGKEIKDWIKRNLEWTYTYAKTLFLVKKGSLKDKTKIKYNCLLDLMELECFNLVNDAATAVFRYTEKYKKFTKYETNTELPIKVAIEEYNNYIKWKESNLMKGRI